MYVLHLDVLKAQSDDYYAAVEHFDNWLLAVPEAVTPADRARNELRRAVGL